MQLARYWVGGMKNTAKFRQKVKFALGSTEWFDLKGLSSRNATGFVSKELEKVKMNSRFITSQKANEIMNLCFGSAFLALNNLSIS